ncbi:MAG TPA: ankyrin repeat domain-containing protein [Candidatus Angelobacter sp.]
MSRLRILLTASFLLACLSAGVCQEEPSYPSFDYEAARKHEIKPHRRTIPIKGVSEGFNQLHLTLVVSPAGNVVEADATAEEGILKFWPQLKPEVLQWKFIPFEKNGSTVTAEIEEYIDLVPPERLPKTHVAPPLLRRDSKIVVTMVRSGCFGSCPSYKVTIRNDHIIFEGHGHVVAHGMHRDSAHPESVRALARKFIAADFYSMDSAYRAGVTDNPTYVLSIEIDGHKKKVVDYVGSWVGMPAIITNLEDAVDSLARTERWIEGGEGLVATLQLEGFNFQSFEAQTMLKEALTRGEARTVRAFLEAGMPLRPLPPTGTYEPGTRPLFSNVGWLNAASAHPDTLKILMAHGASRSDQNDKDLALAGAARSGTLDAVRALIAYGANPNADLSKLIVTENGDAFTLEGDGAGSILIYAAESGDPNVVREILNYHPKLEMRDHKGRTAMFLAGEYRDRDKEGARVECVRLLAEAGADVNARDNDGNTPLHEIFLIDVEEELLKLGADVNARNNEGETPIFTNVDELSIPLFIAHGADLNLRNNKGETVVEAAKKRGPAREEALRKAMLTRKPQ